MKKAYLSLILLLVLPLMIWAESMPVGPQKTPLPSQQGIALPKTREVPTYTFTKLPTTIITNYYDYMIGAYNSLPLRVIPQSADGGYFMAYHGRRQANATRRAFYTYIDAQGNIVNNNEITGVQNHEGFVAIDVDPVSGKPLYAWHANADADANLEVQFTSDAFIAGIAGLFNDITLAADAPTTITPPSGESSSDNEFIWPCLVIGPSPVAGKRRVYVGMRNFVSHAHNASPSENMYIAYADFNGDDIENGVPFVWSHTSIPEQDTWNHDAMELRRPSGTLAADNAGNLIWAGHHDAWDNADNGIDEPEMDVWISPNYGQGTWTRVSHPSKLAAWNPPGAPGSTVGYYPDPDNGDIPFTDEQLFFAISNSSHSNAVVDSQGKIHVPSVWALNSYNNYYYPALQYIKEFIYDPTTQEFEIHEVYPRQDPEDTFNSCFMPWDTEAPWGEVDQYDGDAVGGYSPSMVTAWPFPHWDAAAHTDAMMFHYAGVKLSKPNSEGMMACVWQDSERARMFNFYSDTDYTQFANTPEIWISVSPDNGNNWSEPINLNNVETPQMAGIKPMYTYPADRVIYTGMQGNSKVGKIGIMFYNDFTWGSNVNPPAYHPSPDGGEVMFMELQIVFPPSVANNDVIQPVISTLLLPNYPNPFNPETTVSFDMPGSAHANLSIYNVKGQLVKTLVDSQQGFGRHSYVWNGTDNIGAKVSSGIYFYRLTTNGHTETRKMMLIK